MRNAFKWFLITLVPVIALLVGHTSLPAPSVHDAAALAAPFALAGIIETVGPFSTNTMMTVVENLARPVTGLLDMFFPTITQSQTEKIHFEVDEERRYLAPFAHPLTQAPVKQMRGSRIDTFTPAYVMQKARWTPDRALRRVAGETLGGSMTMEQRRDLALANELEDQIGRITRRKEAMAFEALFSGKNTVEGENSPVTVVDYNRDASLTVNITGTERWDQTNAYPVDTLDDVAMNMIKLSGSPGLDVVMDSAAWRAFRKNKNVQRDLELPKYDAGTISNMQAVAEGLVYKGQYGSYRIWVYTNFYTAADGTDTHTMEGGYALVVGAIDGTQHQGAIANEESYAPVEYYPSSWITPDPSVRWIKTESAPLVVPRRINASARLKVLNAS